MRFEFFCATLWVARLSACQRRDRRHARVFVEQLSQTRSRTLDYLAVLLDRPAMLVAEVSAIDAGEATRKYESLVGGELVPERRDTPQLLTCQDRPLDVRAPVTEIYLRSYATGKREGASKCRVDRAAPVLCAATILDPRQKSLLKGVRDVSLACEPFPTSRASKHLKGRLAVAVLQVLPSEAVAVDSEQLASACPRYQRDRLVQVENPQPAGRPHARRGRRLWWSALLSGRHASMSTEMTRTPPSQFLRSRLQALDRRQQRSNRLGFLVAVVKRFDDDKASQMGALIAYYGFFSLFPLLLVFVTVLGFVLEGDRGAQESVLNSTLSQFPIIGTQLQNNVHSLTGSVPVLVIGLLGATLAGLGITGATQSAFNTIWEIPRRRQLGFLAWRIRGVGMLVVFGLLMIVSTTAAGYVTAETTGLVGVVGGVAVALAANLLLFFTVFRMLTAEEVDTRDLIPGVIVAAILWQILQHVGGYYVDHVVRHARETSGMFAFVLGLLTWLYLGGQVTVLAAEVNVVRARRLWPRRLFSTD
jgi:inner membrane protein YhjD